MSAGGAAAAAAAAEAARRKEEEEMTSYSPGDLSEGWEFKILRSSTGAFRDPERLRAILEDEKRAGWSLVEKFDNGRIRLKRPTSAGQLDGKLDFDAYRTHVGISEGKLAIAILAVVFSIAVVFILFVVLLVRAGEGPPAAPIPPPGPVPPAPEVAAPVKAAAPLH